MRKLIDPHGILRCSSSTSIPSRQKVLGKNPPLILQLMLHSLSMSERDSSIPLRVQERDAVVV
jgi:hypothetical protein